MISQYLRFLKKEFYNKDIYIALHLVTKAKNIIRFSHSSLFILKQSKPFACTTRASEQKQLKKGIKMALMNFLKARIIITF